MNLELLKQAIAPIVEEQGYLMHDLTYQLVNKDHVLQVTIDHLDGIDIEDCVKVSEAVSLYLDSADPIQEDYQLEVTSPGAERVLKTNADFDRFKGCYVLVKTAEQEHLGLLDGYNEDVIKVKNKNKTVEINRIDISLVRLAIKF
ncbi:MAG: ribosome maturation factor RimP [Candidatus Izemoplasmatales bacterium]|jgi:ribosome maturation factor RimP|nr:ribosome maturation factor RimP [bacterium]MDZ4196903.1 ribosome maturation factor RimP [Candidatus Izemoplasmatales bacterium]